MTLWVCGASTFCLRTGTSREPAKSDPRPPGQNLAPFYLYTFSSSIPESGFRPGLIVLYPVPEPGILTGWRCARAARVPLAGRWHDATNSSVIFLFPGAVVAANAGGRPRGRGNVSVAALLRLLDDCGGAVLGVPAVALSEGPRVPSDVPAPIAAVALCQSCPLAVRLAREPRPFPQKSPLVQGIGLLDGFHCYEERAPPLLNA